jgi:hypothetical protein
VGVAGGNPGGALAVVRVVGQVVGAAGQGHGPGGVGQQHADGDAGGPDAADADLVQGFLSRERLAYVAGLSLSTVARLDCQPRARCHVRTLGLLARALDQPTAALAVTAWPVGPDARPVRGVPDAVEHVRSSWSCSRTFSARPDQMALARAFLRRVLTGCPALEDAVLICS